MAATARSARRRAGTDVRTRNINPLITAPPCELLLWNDARDRP
jgi:hypothetical protein